MTIMCPDMTTTSTEVPLARTIMETDLSTAKGEEEEAIQMITTPAEFKAPTRGEFTTALMSLITPFKLRRT